VFLNTKVNIHALFNIEPILQIRPLNNHYSRIVHLFNHFEKKIFQVPVLTKEKYLTRRHI